MEVIIGYAGRPIVDQTGLRGLYSFTLRCSVPAVVGEVTLNADAPSFLTAVQEQLGLQLNSTHTAQDVLIIDRVNLPTPD